MHNWVEIYTAAGLPSEQPQSDSSSLESRILDEQDTTTRAVYSVIRNKLVLLSDRETALKGKNFSDSKKRF